METIISVALVCKLTFNINKAPLTVESIPLSNCSTLALPQPEIAQPPINLDGDITKHPGWVKNDSKGDTQYVIPHSPVGQYPTH